MLANIKTLSSKLRFTGSSDTIIREELHPLMIQIPLKKITTVIAGAGYGKSTLVAQAIDYLKIPAAWYRLEKSDGDFTIFLKYLITGIQNNYPKAGNETLRRIEEAPVLENEREPVIYMLLSELEKSITENLIIVLDDYHHISDVIEIKGILELFLENLSPFIHLVFVSRAAPDLPLSLFRSRREVLDIGEKDLAFSTFETDQFFKKLFGLSLQRKSIDMLHQKTGGWVSSLVLFYHSLQGETTLEIEELLFKLKGSTEIISRYLEENVYNRQTSETKLFLQKTSLLTKIDVSLCDQLLKIDQSKAILKRLEEKHLFTFAMDEDKNEYCYHNLFQDFLQTKLYEELSRNNILNLHHDIAVLMEATGDKEEALNHYLKGEHFEAACRLLGKIGQKLIYDGRLKQLKSLIDDVPDNYKKIDPWIQYLQAQILNFSHESIKAIKYFKDALNIFRYRKQTKKENLCLKELGMQYYLSGEFIKAAKMFKELISNANVDPVLSIEIFGHLTLISSFLGKMKDADRYYREGISLTKKQPDESIRLIFQSLLSIFHGSRYLYSGDFAMALKLGKQAGKIQSGDPRIDLISNQFLSNVYFYLGDFSKGLEASQTGLRIMIERGMQDITFAWLLFCCGINCLGTGKIEAGTGAIKSGLKLFQKTGNRWGEAQSYISLCSINIMEGHLAEAKENLKFGQEAIDGLTMPFVEAQLKICRISLLLDKKQFEEAVLLLKETEKIIKPFKYLIAWLSLLYVRLYWIQNKKQTALNKLQACLKLIQKRDCHVVLSHEQHWIIPPLVETFAMGRMESYLEKIFRQWGGNSTDELEHLKKNRSRKIKKAAFYLSSLIPQTPPPKLKIFCLGPFRLFQGDTEISQKNWKSKKALKLFKYLLYCRDKNYLPKEMLMEFLWPEDDPKKTKSRLHVTINSLRKTLEPEMSIGAVSSYMLSGKNSYKLSLEAIEKIDMDDFTQALSMGLSEKNPEKAMRHFKKAETLYTGDFLENEPYEEWCFEERDSLKEQYLQVLTSLINYHESIKDFLTCIEYAKKYLKKDKYSESMYQRLITYYAKTDNRAMGHKIYEKCKKAITEELDSELSRKTVAIYEEFM